MGIFRARQQSATAPGTIEVNSAVAYSHLCRAFAEAYIAVGIDDGLIESKPLINKQEQVQHPPVRQILHRDAA